MKKVSLIATILLFVLILIYALIPPKIPISPAGQPFPNNYNIKSKKYIVLGFAPYWNMKKISTSSLNSLTHFAYFALHLQGNGDIYTHVNKNEEDPGYTNYQRLLANNIYKNLVLTFMQSDEDALVSLLNSPTARTNAITNILKTTSESGAIGINIDFEPVGPNTDSLRQNFTLFIKELHLRAKSNSEKPLLITISIYPSAASKTRIWDLSALSPLTDYFVVMTYDYTMPKSERAGPNSPLRDFTGSFEHSIIKNINQITQFVPSYKLLLGIPLYGYEWDTIDTSKYSNTLSRGSTASLERIETMRLDNNLEILWDRNTLTPYGISTESGKHTQIYFENDVSIRLKLDFVSSSNLGGIALWALGYDNNVPWLWPTIDLLH
ncbi:MAG: hypothetical protein E6R05_06680 [Candidatus Moraniibacteriota bacterium]|nr:MAG: hypothetical protein E6R05_06680 [Candidatus Moranbacteria bacterium]